MKDIVLDKMEKNEALVLVSKTATARKKNGKRGKGKYH